MRSGPISVVLLLPLRFRQLLLPLLVPLHLRRRGLHPVLQVQDGLVGGAELPEDPWVILQLRNRLGDAEEGDETSECGTCGGTRKYW